MGEMKIKQLGMDVLRGHREIKEIQLITGFTSDRMVRER